MSERLIWISAGVILAEFGDRTSDYITVVVGNWRRVTAAVDAITGAKLQ
jgi:hypothetical protein